MPMINCPRCGTPNPSYAQLCTRCRGLLHSPSQPPSAPTPNVSYRRPLPVWVWVVAGIFGLALLGGMMDAVTPNQATISPTPSAQTNSYQPIASAPEPLPSPAPSPTPIRPAVTPIPQPAVGIVVNGVRYFPALGHINAGLRLYYWESGYDDVVEGPLILGRGERRGGFWSSAPIMVRHDDGNIVERDARKLFECEKWYVKAQ